MATKIFLSYSPEMRAGTLSQSQRIAGVTPVLRRRFFADSLLDFATRVQKCPNLTNLKKPWNSTKIASEFGKWLLWVKTPPTAQSALLDPGHKVNADYEKCKIFCQNGYFWSKIAFFGKKNMYKKSNECGNWFFSIIEPRKSVKIDE